MAATEASIRTPGAVARCVDAASGRPRHPVDDDVAALQRDPGLLQAEVRGVRHRADRHQAVRAFDGAAVGQRDHHTVADRRTAAARDRDSTVMPRRRNTSSSTCAASASSPGQHPVARRHQRHAGTERLVRAGELCAGHAGAHHDQVLGQLRRARRPAPRSGSARRRARRPAARAGAPRSRRGRRRHRAPRSRRRPARQRHPLGAVQPAGTRQHPDAFLAEPRPRCRPTARAPARLTRESTTPRSAVTRRPQRVAHAELGGLGDVDHRLGCGDRASCDGTQSVSTADPPRPSRSTTVTSAPSWAATSAASYPPGPPPMITTRVTPAIIRGRHPYACRTLPRRGPLRGVRQQHGSATDARARPHSPAHGTGWLVGLAADLRRRGRGLGGRARHCRRGAGLPGLRHAVRRHRRRTSVRWTGGRAPSWALPQDPGARADARGRRAGLAVRARRTTRAACRPRATSASSPTPPRPPGRPTTTSPSCVPAPAARSVRDLPRAWPGTSLSPVTTSQDPYELAREAARALGEATGVERHDVALVMGSGWVPAADVLGTADQEIASHRPARLPAAGGRRARGQAFAASTVGDAKRADLPRPHPPLRGPGCRRRRPRRADGRRRRRQAVVLTNGAGGIRDRLPAGQPVLITRPHQPDGDLADRRRDLRRPDRPLLPAAARSGPRDRPLARGGRLRPAARTALRDAGGDPHVRTLGGDLVGMSTALEAIAAREAGLRSSASPS